MSSETPKRTCPECGKGEIEPAGVVVTLLPRPLRAPANSGRGRKVIENHRECGHNFSETEEAPQPFDHGSHFSRREIACDW